MVGKHGIGFKGAGLSVALAVSLLGSTAAMATDGYFANGIGARHKALAGAGVADGRDATSAALNPAGILRAGNELDVAASLFVPLREFTGSAVDPAFGPGFTPGGTVESDRNLFLIPNIARNWKTVGNPYFDAVTLSMSGNGGMNTTYPAIARNTAVGNCVVPPGFPGAGGPVGSQTGVYCAGKSGVDLTQLLISLAMAKSFGNLSVGLAPTVAAQLFAARGISTFAGISNSPNSLSNNGHELVFGAGLRGGLEWAVTPSLRLGATGSTKIYSQRFDDYKGLFAENGDFDIPANLQVGIAVDLSPQFTVMADYKRIWYSGVAAISNPMTNALNCPGIGGADASQCLGGANGTGFGWGDMDILKFGMEFRATSDLTLRAGYSYNTQQVKGRDVMFNILAPGVVQHHITGGLMYRWSPNIDLELAGMYAPRNHVTGTEPFPLGNPTHTIDISMAQFELTAGIKYRFDSPAPLK
ncbi:MAG: outer membrane protein transport protein [Hyphomicrobium sp.]